jgi:hypothetical protein
MKKRAKRLNLSRETVFMMTPAGAELLAAKGGTVGSAGSKGNSIPCCPSPCLDVERPPRAADAAAVRRGLRGKKARR